MIYQGLLRCCVVGATCLVLWSPAAVRAQDEDPDGGGDVEAELTRTQEKIAGLQEAKGDLAAAKKTYGELLAASPNSVKYRAHVCRLAEELKQHEEVVRLASELIKQKPRVLRYRIRLARALVTLKKAGEAAAQWQLIATRAPADPESRVELASFFEEIKDSARALKHYDWLITRFPKKLEYRVARVHLLGDLRRGKEQLAALRELERLAPQTPLVLVEAGDYHLGEDRHDEATARYRRALALLPAGKRPRGKASPSLRTRALAGLAKVKVARQAAARAAVEAFREAERDRDWVNDIWERGEDF